MGSVGLNFGSATSGQGFDVTSTVNQIVTNLQQVETPWKNELTTLQGRDTALSSLGTQLSTLAGDLQALTDFNGVFANKQGSSSDTSVLQLTSASSTAVAGTHSVHVQSLAQVSSAALSAVGASDTLTGSITVQVGGGTAQTVNVDSSNPTLAGLAAAINKANIGVTATVLNDTNGAHLSLVSQTDGAAGTLTVTSGLTDSAQSGAAVSVAQLQQGKDAQLTVDGVSLTSAGNSVSGLIPGVTFQLLSPNTAAGDDVQVVIANDVSSDSSSVTSAIGNFVNDYNTVIAAINQQEGKDSSGNPEPLFGSGILAQLQEQLEGAVVQIFGVGSINSLDSIGISIKQDGTLSIDGDTLTSALSSNFQGVVNLFQGTGSFGLSFANTLDNLGNSSPQGLITSELNANSANETALNTSIGNEDALIATQKTNLTTELNEANIILQSIPQQIQQISEVYSAITGFNTGNNSI